MNKNVIISVKGTQTFDNQGTNILELVTEGKYYKKDNEFYLTYSESEVTGMKGTVTTLKISKETVTLLREGAVNTQFIFKQGKKHISHYDTQNGSFTIGVLANEVNIDVDEKGGEIWVDYLMEIDNNKTGENDFHLYIREAGKSNDEFNQCNKDGN